MSYSVTTAPAAEPLSRSEVKEHLHIDAAVTDHDDWIDAIIPAVRKQAETETWRKFVNQTLTLTLRCFPSTSSMPIRLPGGKVQSITSINYVDTDGTSTLWASSEYQSDLNAEPAIILPAYNKFWPSTRKQLAAVTVVYVAGYGATAADVPDNFRHAMKLMCGTYFRHRENSPLVPIGSVTEDNTVQTLLFADDCRDHRLLESIE